MYNDSRGVRIRKHDKVLRNIGLLSESSDYMLIICPYLIAVTTYSSSKGVHKPRAEEQGRITILAYFEVLIADHIRPQTHEQSAECVPTSRLSNTTILRTYYIF